MSQIMDKSTAEQIECEDCSKNCLGFGPGCPLPGIRFKKPRMTSADDSHSPTQSRFSFAAILRVDVLAQLSRSQVGTTLHNIYTPYILPRCCHAYVCTSYAQVSCTDCDRCPPHTSQVGIPDRNVHLSVLPWVSLKEM